MSGHLITVATTTFSISLIISTKLLNHLLEIFLLLPAEYQLMLGKL